jgi:glycosyltransferase involved in cell wall biosynthesis
LRFKGSLAPPERHIIQSPYFTVFTATFNRADTLPRTFRSIGEQAERDFEWIIVDDGSTDGTDRLVAEWIEGATFPISYTWQPNRGKHTALNAGARLARGELFVGIDSDDELTPDALALIRREWEAIPESVRTRYCGLAALCIGQHGGIVGSEFPQSPLDCTDFDRRYRYKVAGEKLFVGRTAALREAPYPEPVGCKNVTPGFIFIDLDKKYLIRHVNIVCRRYWENWGGERQITHSRDIARMAPGHALWHAKILNDQIGLFGVAPLHFFLSAVRFSRFSFFKGDGMVKQMRMLRPALARMLWLAGLPLGALLWMRDRIRDRPAPGS